MTLETEFSLPETIVFGSILPGSTIVSLATSPWSSVSGIRSGYRIIVDGGLGEAVISKDPQFGSLVVEVEIIKQLTLTSYSSGSWSLKVPRLREIKTYLPTHIRDTLILSDYCDSLQDTFIDELQDVIYRLRVIRNWDTIDSDYVDVFLQTIGMFFKSETFDVETKRRFLKEAPNFIEFAGTKYFTNYLSFVVGAFFDIFQLWSKDYKSFIRQPDIPPAEVDLYYPTNHVELEFDADVWGAIAPKTIIDLFYFLSSVPLVLDRINQQIIATDLIVSGTTAGQIEELITGQEV